MGKKLRIGGPNLVEGQRTWIYDRNDTRSTDGADEYGIVPLYYGAEIDYDRAVNAEQLVRDGRATVIEPAQVADADAE